MWNCISFSLIVLIIISPLQTSCYVHLYGKIGDELFGPGRIPCAGETFVLFCDVTRPDTELIWRVPIRGITVTFSETDSPGTTVNFTSDDAIRGVFNLTRVSGGLYSTFTLFDVGMAVPNITEVYCYGDRPSSHSPNLWIHFVDRITAPTFVSLISLNDSVLQVVLGEPDYGAECVTGYSIEARSAQAISTGSSSNLTLVGLNACDTEPENLTAWAHGLDIQGDPVTISTLSSVNCTCYFQDSLQSDEFTVLYQILQNETHDLNISIHSQSTVAADFLAAVSEDSSCEAYSSIDVSPDHIKQLPHPVGRNLTICITASSCSKEITLSIQISPVEILNITTLSSSSVSVTGQVDLSKFQAPSHQLQVTGIATLEDTNMRFTSPTTSVEPDGSFTIIFQGLPPDSTFTCFVEISPQGVAYGSVPDMIPLRTAATSSNIPPVITTDTCNATKPSTDNSHSTAASGSQSHTLGLPTVTALTAILSYLAGALSAFMCTLVCVMLARRGKQRRSLEEIAEVNGVVEPMYDTVGSKPVTSEGTEWSANDAYGLADEQNIYETAAIIPPRSQDNVSLKTNEAYEPAKGIQNPVFNLEANEAYGSVEVEGFEVKKNQAYEHVAHS